VCDEPHPLLVKGMLGHCVDGNIDQAYKVVEQLWALGYSPEDIIGNIFRVCKTYQMAEYLKLDFIKVRLRPLVNRLTWWRDTTWAKNSSSLTLICSR